ncbi:MAG: SIMPL domain-containing protein [Candidatus Pacebacteria bacterium]|nr:SIMPL domain-containing protein [Candidatus Paceibacterota bacterium]
MDENKTVGNGGPLNHQGVRKALMVFLVVLSVFFIFKTINEIKTGQFIGSGTTATNLISVSGTGDVSAVPDIATFSLTVTKSDKSVSVAQQATTDKMNAVISTLKDTYKIDDKDVKTTSYDIQPNYDYIQSVCTQNPCTPSRQVLRDYSVSHSIMVKIRDTAKAGDIIAAVGSLNVEYVSGLSFSIDNQDDLNAQARKKAIDQAEAKAKVLANDLGVTLVRIVSFNEEGSSPILFDRGAMSAAPMMEKAAAPNIPTGENKITSNVTITYEIR